MTIEDLQKSAYELAMLCLQSDLYPKDTEITNLVDKLLAAGNVDFIECKIKVDK